MLSGRRVTASACAFPSISVRSRSTARAARHAPLARRAGKLDVIIVLNSAPLAVPGGVFAPYLADCSAALGDDALYLDVWLSPQRVAWAGAGLQAIRWRE
jgi:hypothetical protein